MMAGTVKASKHLSQCQQHKKPSGEDSKTPILESHLQALQGFSNTNLYVLSARGFSTKTLRSVYNVMQAEAPYSMVMKFFTTYHWLMQCMPVTAIEALSKLQIHLPQTRHSGLPCSTADKWLVEKRWKYGWHPWQKHRRKAEKGKQALPYTPSGSVHQEDRDFLKASWSLPESLPWKTARLLDFNTVIVYSAFSLVNRNKTDG